MNRGSARASALSGPTGTGQSPRSSPTPSKPGLVLNHVSPEVLVDQLVGPLYYRLLVTGEPLSPAYAKTLVRSVLGPEES